MRFLKNGIVVSCLFFLFSTGCSVKIHEDYRFDLPKQDLEWGVLRANLRGKSLNVSDDLIVTSSPYELLIWFSTNSDAFIDCEISLANLSLIDLSTGEKKISFPGLRSDFRRKFDGAYIANFMFKNIKLEYLDYKLSFVYKGSNKCPLNKGPFHVELIFHKNYQERKISFWDSLMGV
jgi:hypothetical protein